MRLSRRFPVLVLALVALVALVALPTLAFAHDDGGGGFDVSVWDADISDALLDLSSSPAPGVTNTGGFDVSPPAPFGLIDSGRFAGLKLGPGTWATHDESDRRTHASSYISRNPVRVITTY